ncbi:hypothetical protein CHUAL_000051 [Chamberlinius hualienensis]
MGSYKLRQRCLSISRGISFYQSQQEVTKADVKPANKAEKDTPAATSPEEKLSGGGSRKEKSVLRAKWTK